MTTDPEPMNQSDLDDEVTLGASDQVVHEMRAETRAETQYERPEMSIWTTGDTSADADNGPAADDDADPDADSAADPANAAAAADPDADSGLADEPTVIRGFGDDPTTPLDDRIKSQIVAQQVEGAPADLAPADLAPANAVGPAGVSQAARASAASGPSLIDGLEPPTSESAFFQLDEMAPESSPEVHTSSRGDRFPIALLALAVLVVAVTVTVVLALLLGSAAL